MTKKSAGRQQRDLIKKHEQEIQENTSTLWKDTKEISKMCWRLLQQNNLIIEPLKSGLREFIPTDQLPILNQLIKTISDDLITFRDRLIAIDAKHKDYIDQKEIIRDPDEIMSMYALAVSCTNEYQEFSEQYHAILFPNTSRINEIIALAQENLCKYLAENEGAVYTFKTGEQFKVVNNQFVPVEENDITDVEVITK